MHMIRVEISALGALKKGMLTGFLFLIAFGASSSSFAQHRILQAMRLEDDQQIDLDGRLEEPVWKEAPPATRFLQQEPVEGEPATERTEVRIVYNSQFMYMGVLLEDSNAEGILGFQKQRDASLASDDRFMWILDTFRDGRTGYFFEINPAGLMGDGLLGTTSGVNKSWDGIWEARVHRDMYGWYAEIRIPFRTLNFDPEEDTWGVNFQRTIRRKNEETLWSGHLRNQTLFEPIFAGTLTGLRGLSQGIGLEVTPYGITSVSNQLENRNGPLEREATDTNVDAGFDVTYSITPSLRAAVSVNTDFAEVEVDQRRVNLTRFPLLFPERRDFFLEGSRVFDFAPRNGANPYFSRRIGLEDGQAIPITYGTRLAGQQGRLDVGFLHVRTSETNRRPFENFTVGRLKGNFGEQSSVGLLVTRRASGHLDGEAFAPDRYTVGADLELTTSKLFGDKNFNFQAFLVRHSPNAFEEDSGPLDRAVHGIRFRYANEPWIIQSSYRQFGDAYDPAVGFNTRNGFRRVEPQVLFTPRLHNSTLIRDLQFGIAYENIWAVNDLDSLNYLGNNALTRGIDLTFLGVEFESGDLVEFSFALADEVLEEAFRFPVGIEIFPDRYRFTTWEAALETASRRPLSVLAVATRGRFWSGHRTQYDLGITYKPLSGISLTSSWEQNWVDLDEGSFTTNLYRFTGGWQLSPWISSSVIVQYDDVSELLTLFSRFRWTLRPGNDVFFIFSRNWENRFASIRPDRFRLRPFETGASLKVNYTHRF